MKRSHCLDREIEQTQEDIHYWQEGLDDVFATGPTKQRIKETIRILKERLRKLKQEKARGE